MMARRRRNLQATCRSAPYRQNLLLGLQLLSAFASAAGKVAPDDPALDATAATDLLTAFVQHAYERGFRYYIALHAVLGLQYQEGPMVCQAHSFCPFTPLCNNALNGSKRCKRPFFHLSPSRQFLFAHFCLLMVHVAAGLARFASCHRCCRFCLRQEGLLAGWECLGAVLGQPWSNLRASTHGGISG